MVYGLLPSIFMSLLMRLLMSLLTRLPFWEAMGRPLFSAWLPSFSYLFGTRREEDGGKRKKEEGEWGS